MSNASANKALKRTRQGRAAERQRYAGKQDMRLTEHLSLAGANLLDCLCREQNYLPYWHMVVDPDQGTTFDQKKEESEHKTKS